MLGVQRLPVERQRNVGAALGDLFANKPRYAPPVVDAAKAVILATEALKAPEGPSMFTIDRTTDVVVTALYRGLEATEKALTDTLVPLGAQQQAALDAARTLKQAWFADGIGFIHNQVGLECDVLLEIKKATNDPEKGPAIKKAIKTLGLGPQVDHLFAHIAVYARKLGLTADGDEETTESAAGRTWHDAYVLFAASVMVAYANDAETRKALLGSYERQLQEHRAGLQKERVKAKKKQKEPAKPSNGGK